MSDLDRITRNARALLAAIPPHVKVVAAAKTRAPEEVLAVIEAGIEWVGHNYVQEAERVAGVVGRRARWHLIGHLQKNKVKQAVELFDMIETVDSVGLGEVLDNRCAAVHKTMPILIEINSGREENKSGCLPERAEELARRLSRLDHLRIQGLMTMAPLLDDSADYRPYFRETRSLYERLRCAQIPRVEMQFLSMGMSDSYRVAIEEGANVVRIGTALFGPRPPDL